MAGTQYRYQPITGGDAEDEDAAVLHGGGVGSAMENSDARLHVSSQPVSLDATNPSSSVNMNTEDELLALRFAPIVFLDPWERYPPVSYEESNPAALLSPQFTDGCFGIHRHDMERTFFSFCCACCCPYETCCVHQAHSMCYGEASNVTPVLYSFVRRVPPTSTSGVRIVAVASNWRARNRT